MQLNMMKTRRKNEFFISFYQSFFKLFISIELLLFPWDVSALENNVELNTHKEIIHRLQKWPQDFDAKNIQEVCGLFAPDLIATYPGSFDKNYEEMCTHFTKIFTNSDQTLHYEPPEIEQVIIEGNLAVVRLIWTLKVSQKNQSGIEMIRERGLDVFRRQPDGSWKIAISYAYPIDLLHN
jgi:ketosteroid isomerase-like protein